MSPPRPVSSAPGGWAGAVPLLQPLALSAATRRAVAGHDGLLTRTRAAAAAASGLQSPELARVQRVRPRTLLAIAALTGAFYYLLPKLAQVGSSWHALQSAHWIWLLLVIAFSALTYLASAISMLGSVTVRLPFWPTVLTQGASSFINRVSPANVGGMALNVRYLQKTGVEPSEGVAAVGVNALAGAIVHVILLVIFLRAGPCWCWPGVQAAVGQQAAADLGDPGRRGRPDPGHAPGPEVRGEKAAAVAAVIPGQPVAGGAEPAQAGVAAGGRSSTLAHVGGLVASVAAFGASASIAQVGAVYLIASFIAAAFRPRVAWAPSRPRPSRA